MNVPTFFRKPVVQKVARGMGYVGFGLVVFLVALVWTFPASRLRSFLEARMSRDGVVVRVEDLSIRGLSTLSLRGVEAEFPPEVRMTPDGREVRTPRTVGVDRLDIGVGLWRLLFGGLSLRIEAWSGDGVLGPVRVARYEDRVEVEVERIRDFPIPNGFPLFGVPFTGLLDGKGSVAYDLKGGWAASTGRLEVKARDVVALTPTLRSQVHGEATLTDVRLGDVVLELNLDKPENIPTLKKGRKAGGKSGGREGSVLQFEKAEVDGTDLKVVVEGQSVLRFLPGRGPGDAQVAVDMAFALSDVFFGREVKSGGTTTTPNRFLKTLLEMDPRWRSASSGGYYGVVCSGSVRAPSCIPKKPSIRGGDFKRPERPAEAAEPPAENGRDRAPARPPVPAAETPRVVPSPPMPPASPPPPQPEPSEPTPPPPPADMHHPPVVVPGPVVPPPAVREGMEVIRTITPTIIGRPKIRRGVELTGDAPTEEAAGPGPGEPATVTGPGEGEPPAPPVPPGEVEE